ncbi:hypothetical protein LS684_06765 [Cytobacillus spongiae]|uniref:hypothetical protein n=1 Tax=Cytobacillus spongiae TaxID=2901381 RepID=UPI001F202215|nr:hypothetical protein [Cytobacillus spongiae]UII57138.1 hypothetical protein LS684_06765 [Cytobacillus spongiae]
MIKPIHLLQSLVGKQVIIQLKGGTVFKHIGSKNNPTFVFQLISIDPTHQLIKIKPVVSETNQLLNTSIFICLDQICAIQSWLYEKKDHNKKSKITASSLKGNPSTIQLNSQDNYLDTLSKMDKKNGLQSQPVKLKQNQKTSPQPMENATDSTNENNGSLVDQQDINNLTNTPFQDKNATLDNYRTPSITTTPDNEHIPIIKINPPFIIENQGSNENGNSLIKNSGSFYSNNSAIQSDC